MRTASGRQRATVTARGIGRSPAGTVGRSGRVKTPARVGAKPVAAAKPASNRRRRPTAEQSRAAGLTPIADIRARQAAQAASMDAGRIRRKQSNTTRARGQQVVAAQGKQRAPFGRYSTIKNPAAEGSFPQMAPGRTGQGMAQAAKGRSSHSRPSNTKAINRLNTLRRRVQYLRKDQQDFKFDKFGDRYAGPKLAKARRDLTSAIAGARGARVSIRTKSQAQGAQASRRQKLINQANSRIISTKTMQRPSSNQPNLLTGAVDRVPGRKFRSARQRPRR